MASLTRICRGVLQRKSAILRTNPQLAAFISTSKKDKEPELVPRSPLSPDDPEFDFADPKKQNWVTYGWSTSSQEEDRTQMHVNFFLSVTIGLVTSGFLLVYWTNNYIKDWSRREGFLELRRREELGLPLIDREFIPLDRMKLPDDEEIGDIEIVI